MSEAAKMEDLGQPFFVAKQRGEVRRLRLALVDLDHVGRAVAGRQLHHAEPVAMRLQPQRFGLSMATASPW